MNALQKLTHPPSTRDALPASHSDRNKASAARSEMTLVSVGVENLVACGAKAFKCLARKLLRRPALDFRHRSTDNERTP